MVSLVSKERRKELLVQFGAPPIFIENIGHIDELKFRLEDIEGSYFYLPKISNYKILQGLNIIPIYDEGDSFRVFAYNDAVRKIIYFELENDQVYKNYDTNWALLLFDIMFQYFNDDIENGLTIEKFTHVGEQIGFKKSASLFRLLDIPLDEFNKKYNKVEKWKKEITKTLELY